MVTFGYAYEDTELRVGFTVLNRAFSVGHVLS